MHLRPFVKKHTDDKEAKFIQSFRQYPKLITIITTMLLPGIYLGQSIAYHAIWMTRKHLWGMSLRSYKISIVEILIKLFVLYSFYYSGSFLVVYSYLVGMNISYVLAIMPDHDMDTIVANRILSSIDKPQDWGEIQVRNSGNFAVNNTVLTELYGGINYQIEHHLFPTVCHVHYRAISRIVEETCKEYNIPYVSVNSVYEAFSNVLKNFDKI